LPEVWKSERMGDRGPVRKKEDWCDGSTICGGVWWKASSTWKEARGRQQDWQETRRVSVETTIMDG